MKSLSAAAVLGLLILAAGCSRSHPSRMDVKLTNRSTELLSSITLEHGYEFVTVGVLEPGRLAKGTFATNPETPFRVEFTDEFGIVRVKELNIPLEPGFGGTIEFVFNRGGNIQTIANVFLD